LLTKKQIDFGYFCLILDLINKKEHLQIEGVKKIVNIRASMNKGLTENLNKKFSDIIPVEMFFKINNDIKHSYWLIGFVDAEGCFYIKPIKKKI